MSDSDYSEHVRTPSPEPFKKTSKAIRKRKSFSPSRSDSEYTRTPSPEPSKKTARNIKKTKSSSPSRFGPSTRSLSPRETKKKLASKARTPSAKSKKSASSSSNNSKEKDIFKIIREEEKYSDEHKSKKTKTTTSSFTSRVSAGCSRRTAIKDGNFLIDLKVYTIDDYQNGNPVERYKNALASVKLQCKEESPEWSQIQKFLGKAFSFFEDCEPVYFTNYKK